jgi:LmbE family N-acetylglucosaminyl deacetylase
MLDACSGEAFSAGTPMPGSGAALSAIRYNFGMLRLMCVTAHPDDEAGGFGGTLLKYRSAGIETSVVCLTPGQAATHRGGAKSDQELAEMRKKEFAAACAILKVSRPVIFDYPDGQLYLQNLNRVVYALTLEIRQFRPQVLITFGADGGVTGHPDHSMAGMFASLAFQWAGRKNRYADQFNSEIKPHRTQKLYYGTADFVIPGRQPITQSPATTIIDVKEHFETKVAAFKSHTSQAPLFELFEQNVRNRGERELFHLAASVKGGPLRQETDLFEGIDNRDET